MSPDEHILLWLQTRLSSEISDMLFNWFSSPITFTLPILLALLIYAAHRERWRGAGWWLALTVVIAFSDQFGNLLKSLFSELRPCAVNDGWRSILYTLSCGGNTKGMPSNHALNFYTASLFVILTRPTWKIWHVFLLLAALLTSLSRVYLDKHYPSQVIAGIFLGINMGMAASLVYRFRTWLTPLLQRLSRLVRLERWPDQTATSIDSPPMSTTVANNEGLRYANSR
jgi:undecaprenyl-diphosphatase